MGRRAALVLGLSFLAAVRIASADSCALPSFGPPVPLTGLPSNGTIGDFNGDGIPDVVALDFVTGTLKVFLGNGSGGFLPPKVTILPASVSALKQFALVTADFNRDGKLDLAVAANMLSPGYHSGTLVVFLGDGSGAFSAPRLAAGDVFNVAFENLVAADFDGDGILDLVVSTFNEPPPSSHLILFHGDGLGGFIRTGTVLSIPQDCCNSEFVSVTVADLNGDGFPDLLATIEPPLPLGLYVYLGDGHGGFSGATGYYAGYSPNSIAVGDFNGDGIPDVAVAASSRVGNGSVTVFIGKGGGALADGVLYESSPGTRVVNVADVNGDGILDLVTAGTDIWVFPGDGHGKFAKRIPFTTGESAAGLQIADINGDGRPDILTTNPRNSAPYALLNTCSASMASATLFVPALVEARGVGGVRFASALTVVNHGPETAALELSYNGALEGVGGTVTTTVPDGRQIQLSNSSLATLGLPLPASDRGGSLRMRFTGLSSPNDVGGLVRTTTSTPTAGFAMPALPIDAAFFETAYVGWVTQSASDRSNVGLVNVGVSDEGDIVLRVTVFSTDPASPGLSTLPNVRLAPGEWKQINGILPASGLTASRGYVKAERVSGSARFYVYGVVNDQITSDGSFVSPIGASLLAAQQDLIVPVLVENPAFSSELVVTNTSQVARRIRFIYVADAITALGNAATFYETLAPGQQLYVPTFVGSLRDRGLPGVGPPGANFAGALFLRADDDLPGLAGILAGARTATPGDGGRYGLYSTALPDANAASGIAWLYGLVQDAGNRTNLALVNTGAPDAGDDVFAVDLYDASTGSLAATFSVSVAARHWVQINQVLTRYAPGVATAYARVRGTSGLSPFVTYAVINDGPSPGLGTGDGSFIEMRRE